MYVSVIPAIHSIRGVDAFTYAVSDEHVLQRGTIVWIPWRNRKIIGLIWEVNIAKPNFAVKMITKDTPIVLPEKYCQFIAWFAEYYHISLSYTVKIIVPTILQRRTTVASFLSLADAVDSLRVSKKILPSIQKITQQLTGPLSQPHTILYRTLSEPMSIVVGLLKQTTQRLAIIVPEEYLAIILARVFQKITLPIVVSSHLNGTQLFQAWQAMLQQTHRLFIGTKRLSLFPLTQVDSIILLDPEDAAQKQWDKNPRYHTSTVTEYFCKQNGSKLIRFSQSPAVTQIHSDVIVSDLVADISPPSTTIIDLNNSYDSTYHGLLSPSLLAECEQTKTIFLWLNKKGAGKLLYCLDCHSIETDVQRTDCGQCKGTRLVKRGHGTTSLVQALRRALPQRTIYECTKDQGTPKINYTTKPIIVATNYALPFIQWQRIEYTGVISIDYILAEPHFRATERALHQLVKLRNFTGQLAVQTYAPEHPVWLALKQYYPKIWYENELHQRQQQHLPPFGSFITAIHKITKQAEPITTFDSPLWRDSNYMIDREP